MKKLWWVMVILVMLGCAHAPTTKETPVKVKKASVTKIKLLPTPPKVELLFPIREGEISSTFGPRGKTFHRGIDIAAPLGTKIKACEGGKVVAVGKYSFLSGYGNTVTIKHFDQIYTYYCHLSKLQVKKGEQVIQGQIIGEVGNSGKSRGYHLHLELIMHGKNHNPIPFVLFDKNLLVRWSLWVKSVKKSINLSGGIKKLLGE